MKFKNLIQFLLQAQVEELQTTVSHLKDQNLVLRAAQTDFSNGKGSPSNHIEASSEELEKYKAKVRDLENRLSGYALKLDEYERKSINENGSELENTMKQKSEELEKLRKDQEDLLELLTDQDNKITMYKERLVALGEKVNFLNCKTILKFDNLIATFLFENNCFSGRI